MYRSITEPIRREPSFDERWGTLDFAIGDWVGVKAGCTVDAMCSLGMIASTP